MTKLMLAVHDENVAPILLGPDLRRVLAAVGATALQVNVDDEAVAPAMRLHGSQPLSAVLSVWTDGPSTPIVDAIAEAVGSQPDAYRVTEVVRLDPRPVPDGERAAVLANIALLRRPPDMSREDYLDYWMLHHTAVAIRTQNTEAYVQNIVEEVLTDGSPEVAGIVEEHFPMAAMTDPHVFYGSGGDDAELTRRITELMASVARFGAADGLDLMPSSRYFWALTVVE
ncbi:MAG TPA: EthD domain-containing protein [Gordonia sp. (in: high G+C Gram-positive bacteria)]|uniref:EthD domain-containing protein n=1 Tax=unclassified Gordonia (in: high G+C Gram-positive bacteria) TaxID=2657482 RepID=UPI000F9E6BD1|nr:MULTISPECIES: EthD domain-containing protein [unclassified Gordonia (in: high G+C Gram-positive bacteria)]RUP40364.1 MAG: hypothetical protein EKK60_03990 [Gordonia sp. (in: high G+C Gram-positive bacteria)]HNP57066.1 EthD domain-containing protein [Gordonia sp. (in: high G+C Gram-positive bacteria)]HRC49397.1 EthD domain-containing protein [Gordonia sp. (in: high G+C Gram-positive bacteria)]